MPEIESHSTYKTSPNSFCGICAKYITEKTEEKTEIGTSLKVRQIFFLFVQCSIVQEKSHLRREFSHRAAN